MVTEMLGHIKLKLLKLKPYRASHRSRKHAMHKNECQELLKQHTRGYRGRPQTAPQAQDAIYNHPKHLGRGLYVEVLCYASLILTFTALKGHFRLMPVMKWGLGARSKITLTPFRSPASMRRR